MWDDIWQLWNRSRQAEAGDGDDPERLLEQAERAMIELHTRNRERAVQAITQKNNLEQMVDDTERRVLHLRTEADVATENGDAIKAAKLLHEADNYERTLQMTRGQLEQAIETSEQVKAAIKREEEKIRQKTAEALVLKAQWKAVQIERAITITMAQIAADAGQKPSRERAAARHGQIRELVIEAQTYKNDLLGRVQETEARLVELCEAADAARQDGDDEAENRLLRLREQSEARLAQTNHLFEQAAYFADRARVLFQDEDNRIRTGGVAPHSETADTDSGWVMPVLIVAGLLFVFVLLALLL